MNMCSKKAFVTGGTGFVGFYIAKSLIENGLKVCVLARKKSPAQAVARLRALGAELIVGDILEPRSYAHVLQEASFVFHSAAVHKVWVYDNKPMFKVNVEATQRLFELAVKHRVEQFIFTSSVKSIGLYPGKRVADESDTYNLWNVDTDYGRSKYLAEEFLLRQTESTLVKILNPAAVIGPGDETLTPMMSLIRDFLKKKVKFSIPTSLGLVDVRDVGYAHFLAIQKARQRERYILCAANVSLDDLFFRLSAISGIRAPKIRVPYCVAFGIAYACRGLSALTRVPPVVNVKSLRVAKRFPAYDGRKAQQAMGVRYKDINETLRDAVTWLKGKI